MTNTNTNKDVKQTALANAAKALKTLTGTKNAMFVPKVRLA